LATTFWVDAITSVAGFSMFFCVIVITQYLAGKKKTMVVLHSLFDSYVFISFNGITNNIKTNCGDLLLLDVILFVK